MYTDKEKIKRLTAWHVANEKEIAALRKRVALLEAALNELLDGLDANYDEREGLSNEEWLRRIKNARSALE